MNKVRPNNEFETPDINLAATFYALGIQLLKTNWIEGRCYFVFGNSERVQGVVDGFWRKGLSVEPQCILNAFRSLKALVRERPTYDK